MTVPVTILCGGLGAGKTTLLSHLLAHDDRDVAVVVNDVGEVNVDADLVEARTDLETGEEVVALENGCICCSLGSDLSRSVIRLWKTHDFDALVIEASGVGEPEPIAHQFVRGPAGGPYDLDAVVTVVNARQFFDTFADADSADSDEPPRRRGPDESGSRPLADLLLEQVEFCDILVLNKCDLVTDAERERVIALLETLTPRATIVPTEFGRVPVGTVLETNAFDLETARNAAGWKQALEPETDDHNHDHDHANGDDHDHGHDHDHDHAHAHPPERYGIAVETYHRLRPFHPLRLIAFLENVPEGLVRAKGLCWIAGRERAALTLSLAGSETTLEVTGRWIASFGDEQQAAYRNAQPDLPWDDRWGDREIRLALIGRNLDLEALASRLDDCLLTDAEMDSDWSTLENPTPTSMGDRIHVSSHGEHDRRR